jgi:hypothetical protein
MIIAYCDQCGKEVLKVKGNPSNIWHLLLEKQYFGQDYYDYDSYLSEAQASECAICKDCRDTNKANARNERLRKINDDAAKRKCPEKWEYCIGLECAKFSSCGRGARYNNNCIQRH